MLTRKVIDRTIARIALMPFFPASDPNARAALIYELSNMAESDDQLIWLGHRMIQLYPQGWPGISEMRALFCNRFQPCDGLQVNSVVYECYPTEVELGKVPGISLPPSRTEREEEQRKALAAQKVLPGEVSGEPLPMVAELLSEKVMPATRSTAVELKPRSERERQELQEAEKQIAEARPTLTEEEKARRLQELQAGLKS